MLRIKQAIRRLFGRNPYMVNKPEFEVVPDSYRRENIAQVIGSTTPIVRESTTETIEPVFKERTSLSVRGLAYDTVTPDTKENSGVRIFIKI